MKRLALVSVFISLALVLSACSVHLGLSKLLGGGSGSTATKTVKATHTPPVGGTASAGGASSASTGTKISLDNGKYRPKNLTIKVGTTLTWTNNGSTPESVTSDAPGVFDSGLLQPGATWTFTFSTVGTFPYHSTADKNMFGSVTVTP